MRRLILCIFIFSALTANAARAFVLVPTPQKVISQGAEFTPPPSVSLSSLMQKNDPRVIAAIRQFLPNAAIAAKPFAPAKNILSVYASDKKDTITAKLCAALGCAALDPATFKESEYFLGIANQKTGPVVLILFSKPIGEFYAVKTLKQIYVSNRLTGIAIHDWPDFPVRGILEGFYGAAWPDDKRLAMFPWMADYKYNLYLYTPKDDNRLRLVWRSKYGEKELAYIHKANQTAHENFVKYCWGLSPGMTIRFSSKRDFDAAVAKYRSVMDQGVTCFTIAFDDVGLTLLPDDRATYKTYWEAQVDFANRLLDALLKINPDITISFVPNDYWGELAPTSEYLHYVGKHLDKRYQLGYTGNKIIPETVTPEDVKYYASVIRRNPILGDNYPVTDSITTAGGRLSLGPLRGRDPRLYRYLPAFAANAMPLAESSKLAFLTIADFIWNGYAYDADFSWENACKILAGEKTYEPLLFFAKQSESSFIWRNEAIELFEDARAFWMAYKNEQDYDMASAVPALKSIFAHYSRIGQELESVRTPANSAMLDEMKLWIQKLTAYGDIGGNVLDLLVDKRDGKPVDPVHIDTLEASWKRTEENKAVMTSMVMYNFLNRAFAVLRDQPEPKEEKLRSVMSAD